MSRGDKALLQWLCAGDAAIVWQVSRDLLGRAAATVERERQAVAREGWGARLLALQDPEGSWGGGLYNPKWTSTTYTLLLLRDFGLSPSNAQATRACLRLLDGGLRPDGGVNFGRGSESETCVTGMVLSVAAYFRCDDPRLDTIAAYLLEQQMPDGGWNCRYPRDATHGSFHTTISALEALGHYGLFRTRKLRTVLRAQGRAREFLSLHQLFRSHRTGRVIKSEFERFSFPPRWHYDILRALDHFRESDAERDPRLSEAIDIVRRHRHQDGRWRLEHAYPGKTFFPLESVGAPSRWNTLRALRVLNWWDRGAR